MNHSLNTHRISSLVLVVVIVTTSMTRPTKERNLMPGDISLLTNSATLPRPFPMPLQKRLPTPTLLGTLKVQERHTLFAFEKGHNTHIRFAHNQLSQLVDAMRRVNFRQRVLSIEHILRLVPRGMSLRAVVVSVVPEALSKKIDAVEIMLRLDFAADACVRCRGVCLGIEPNMVG